jgi:CheY-like chemotaxis protein
VFDIGVADLLTSPSHLENMSVKKSAAPAIQSRILLVDDNANGLKARKMVLEELGYGIVTAANGHDALDRFSPQKFDLVVTDYKMPRMDGLELIGNLRKLAPEVPIVLISGFVDPLGLNEENTKADAVIQKSANEVSHLLRAVARLLRQKAQGQKPPRKPAGATTPLKAKRKTV